MAIRKVKMSELKTVAAHLKSAAELLDRTAADAVHSGADSLYLQVDWLINTATPQVNDKIIELGFAISREISSIRSGQESPGERKFKRAKQRRQSKPS